MRRPAALRYSSGSIANHAGSSFSGGFPVSAFVGFPVRSGLSRFFGPLLPEGSAVPGVLGMACLLLGLSPFLSGASAAAGRAANPAGATAARPGRKAA